MYTEIKRGEELMKEFKKSLLLVILWQIIGWVIFAFCDEAIQILYNDLQKYLLSIIFLIVTPIIYLIYSKKIITKNNYSSKKFNAFFLILWVVFSIALGFTIGEYKPKDGQWLDGLQYVEYGIALLFPVIIVIIVKIVYSIYKFLKNKIRE